MCIFPEEIIERILKHCDGKTLLIAYAVNEQWKNIIQRLTKRTKIWKRNCLRDIPKGELVKYTEKYINQNDIDKWLNIYKNWCAWQDIDGNIEFDIHLSPIEVSRITSIAVSGRYVAVGSEDGRIKIFNDNWDLLHTTRYQAIKITEITFMCDEEYFEARNGRIYVLIAYKTGTLVLTEFDGKLNELSVIQDVKLHSVYKKYLCYEKRGGRITISKLCKNSMGTNVFCEITFLRIYSPSEVSCLHMWGGTATFLINNEVKVLKYDENVPPISIPERRVRIKFCINNHPRLERSCHIYRDDIIICASTTEDDLREQFLELFILGEKGSYSKKLFNTWDVLESYITCMFLYGNTFIIGVDIGNIYFYHISSWKEFDIRNYQKKMIVGRHPINGIDVREDSHQRKFYVHSSFKVHEITGLRVNDYQYDLHCGV
ncbi:uncharacterized protein LOC108733279 [Agrilus planipennis]|uniref:Uncharacterized protein LOC108733279 n=1 Tax=Agrilus planipennis TaxID=224129 RepID=A0A7F5R721_AGRPL|nr:uncharacterized protein LOC108733279 [Agrilus planipennis]